jgi:hypothetical protein
LSVSAVNFSSPRDALMLLTELRPQSQKTKSAAKKGKTSVFDVKQQ